MATQNVDPVFPEIDPRVVRLGEKAASWYNEAKKRGDKEQQLDALLYFVRGLQALFEIRSVVNDVGELQRASTREASQIVSKVARILKEYDERRAPSHSSARKTVVAN